jgi:hypothetical protein
MPDELFNDRGSAVDYKALFVDSLATNGPAVNSGYVIAMSPIKW